MRELIRALYKIKKIDLAKEVYAAIKPKLKGSIRNKINKDIGNLITPKNKTRYFREIPLDELFDILDKYGVVPLQEDNTKWSGLLVGREGRTFFRIAPKDTKDDKDMYTAYSNAGILLTWYKINNKYEVICYVS